MDPVTHELGAATDGRPGRLIMAKRKWSYWRLMDRTGLTIGFMRQRGKRQEYVGLTGDRGERCAIGYADRVALPDALPGFRYLKGCH